MLKQAYGNKTMTPTQLNSGTNGTKTAELRLKITHLLDLSQSKDGQQVEKVREVIRSNRRFDSAGSKPLSRHFENFVSRDLGMQRIAFKFVPRLLTDEQELKVLEVRQELFHRAMMKT
jgi:hypothetical protein